jgi:hypothetical protein
VPRIKHVNFLEALKESSQQRRPTSFEEAFRANADQKAPASFVDALKSSGAKQPTTESQISITDNAEYEQKLEEEKKAREQERMLAKQQEEELFLRMKARQEEVKKEIEVIRDAILKIAKSLGAVGHEFEKAAFQAPANPGRYHVSFFAKLKETLELIKKRLDDSASWMHTMNNRAKKMPYFWTQVQKSGTKYQFSSERYMQMSAG